MVSSMSFKAAAFNLSLLFLWLANSGCNAQQDMDEEMKKIARQNGIDPDNLNPGTVMLTPPKLSDEEEGSQFMPKAHRCDGCHAVAFQLGKRFEAAERQKKKSEKLSEAEILTSTEEICNSEFKEYGLKNVQGKNYLSGEGLEANSMSGMVETGGKWTKRLQNICKEIMGEYEEDTVYKYYIRKGAAFKTAICKDYCGKKGKKGPKDEL